MFSNFYIRFPIYIFIRISIFIITKVTKVNKLSFFIISNFLNNQQSLIVFCSVTDFSQSPFPPLDPTQFLMIFAGVAQHPRYVLCFSASNGESHAFLFLRSLNHVVGWKVRIGTGDRLYYVEFFCEHSDHGYFLYPWVVTLIFWNLLV